MTAAAPESPAARFRALLSDLGDAVRGTALDYTKGSLGRAVLLLSVPMMLEMVMESVFAVVDVYFVSTLGSSAVATVGLTESVLTLVYAVGIGLSMGATALVARRIGEKEPEAAADTAVQCIVVAVAASIPFAIAGIFFSRELLTLMGADAWSIEHGSRYTAWMLGGCGSGAEVSRDQLLPTPHSLLSTPRDRTDSCGRTANGDQPADGIRDEVEVWRRRS
jgi:hypothetical protein